MFFSCQSFQQELLELKETFASMKADWDNEKMGVDKIRSLKEEIEQVNDEIQIAQRGYDLNKAAELQYGRLPQLQKQLQELEEKEGSKDKNLVHENVSEEEIAGIVSKWTGIPVSHHKGREKSRVDSQKRKRNMA